MSNIQAAGGGVVHAPHAERTEPLCRPGSHSGLGLTNRKRSSWRKTSGPVTCKKCLARVTIQPGDTVRIIGQHPSEMSFNVMAVEDGVATIRYPAGLTIHREWLCNLIKQETGE